MKKKWMKGLAVCLTAAMTVGMLAGTFSMPEVSAKKTPVIVLDPGHDDDHTGARFSGLEEEDVVLKITKECKNILESNYDVKIYMTRTDEACAFGGKSISTRTCLESRALFAKKKKASAFISFHINSSTGTVASGAETYSATQYMNTEVGKKSHLIAQKVQARLVKLGLVNRGVKYANHLVTKNCNEFGIPAALIEHGFIRNTSDRRWFTSNAKIKKLAQADADGIAEALGLAEGGSGISDYDDEEDYYDDEEDDEYYDDEYYDDYTSSGKKLVNAKVKLAKIEGKEFNALSLTWEPFAGAASYDVLRKTTSGQKKTSSFKKIASTKATTYTDYTCETATTYEYTVRALSKKYQTKNATPTLKGTSPSGMAAGLKVEAGVYNSAKVSWQPTAYATGYLLYRAPLYSSGKTGKYEQIAQLKGSSSTSYLDTTAEAGTTVKYRVAAYRVSKGKKILGKVTAGRKVLTGANPTTLTGVSWKNSSTARIDWKEVEDAAGYEVSRSTDEDYDDYKVLKKVQGELTHLDSDIEEDTGYSYRVRAFFKEGGLTFWGAYSDARRIKSGNAASRSASTKIAGSPKTSVSQMVAYFESSDRKYPEDIYMEYGAETIEDFATIVYDESVEEGIRPEVVFAQICKETNFLQFGGTVMPEQCNFAGLGATDGGAVAETFDSVQTGVRAQVQHLKAYANTESLVNDQVDPRFKKVKRGCAEYVEWLGINENPNSLGWASAKNYGYSLVDGYIEVLLETDV